MKKKKIVKLLEDFHEDLERFNQKVQKSEGNGDRLIQESWVTVVEKFKELEARNADQRHGVQSLLRRIETLEIQFREKIELSEKILLANKKALLTTKRRKRKP